MNPVQNLMPYLFKIINLNIFIPSSSRPPKWSLFSGFQSVSLYAFLVICVGYVERGQKGYSAHWVIQHIRIFQRKEPLQKICTVLLPCGSEENLTFPPFYPLCLQRVASKFYMVFSFVWCTFTETGELSGLVIIGYY